MANLYLFRGISATGKTTITNRIGRIHKMPVFRKDDVYDNILLNLGHGDKNTISYDVLASMINSNLELGNDIIVDLALAHKLYIEGFLKKINIGQNKLVPFFFICSNKEVWKNRWKERLKNPTPNQLFMSLEEIDDYYAKMDFSLMENEIIIDSVIPIDEILNTIGTAIRVSNCN